jgi:hypothetical protein
MNMKGSSWEVPLVKSSPIDLVKCLDSPSNSVISRKGP